MQIVIGIIGLGVIIFVHEFGHFLAAKYYKVEVVEFAVGMGPRLLSCMLRGTLYSVRLLPLGGFCRMKSEHEAGFDYKNAHTNAVIPPTEGTLFMLPLLKKAVVLLAGSGANVVWYGMMSLLLFVSGYETEVLLPRIDPVKGKSAYEAGLRIGDTITRFDNVIMHSFTQLAEAAQKRAGKTVDVEYTREGITYTTKLELGRGPAVLGVYPLIVPVIDSVRKSKGSFVQMFQSGDIIIAIDGVKIHNSAYIYSELKKHKSNIVSVLVQRDEKKISIPMSVSRADPMRDWGIAFSMPSLKRWNDFPDFIRERIEQMKVMISSTLKVIVTLFTFQKTEKDTDVAGPIRIISLVGGETVLAAQTKGVMYALWQFININAVLSFAIALMNMIPIPVLDGGQLLFYGFHALRKRAPKYKSLIRFQAVGVVIMLFLFVFVMFKDISWFSRY